jgi:hypothetical protein
MIYTVFTFCTLFLLAFSAVQGHDQSPLYKRYKAAASKTAPVLKNYDVASPASNDHAARDRSLFYPPLPGQNSRDYHPIKKASADNDTIIYYSWHLHVYFFHEDDNVTQRTLALRDNFMKRFSVATCDDDCFMGGPFDTCTQGNQTNPN